VSVFDVADPFTPREAGRSLSMYWQPYKYDGYAWGMTIDQNVCTGCNSCGAGGPSGPESNSPHPARPATPTPAAASSPRRVSPLPLEPTAPVNTIADSVRKGTGAAKRWARYALRNRRGFGPGGSRGFGDDRGEGCGR